MKLSEDVGRVLSTLAITGNQVVIAGQLDRKLYTRVNAALEALGGAWNRRARAHVFAGDPTDAIDAAIEAGEVRTAREDGFFRTPPAVVAEMMRAAEVRPGMRALEPSAGDGAIVTALLAAGARVTAVERDPARCAAVRALTPDATMGDFLGFTLYGRPFDRVVMNPPFGKRADVHHVTHALGMLAQGGRLVAVMSAGIAFRQDRLTREFMARIDRRRGSVRALPDGAFAESGTGVRAVLVTTEAI